MTSSLYEHEIQQLYLCLDVIMLISMNVLKRVLIISILILISVPLGSCEIATPISGETVTATPSLLPPTPSITPSPVPTTTPSPTNTITATPDFCNSAQSQDKIQVMSNDLLVALRPGGPVVFDRILVEQNPAWAKFQQNQHGETRSAGVIFHETALGPEWGTGINPAVILLTYGIERNWELPANGDLVSEVDRIRAEFYQYEYDWVLGKIDQSQYPVANTATYALYRYFNGDLSKLETWCHTYVQIYGVSPLK